jgi:hypothetical protein
MLSRTGEPMFMEKGTVRLAADCAVCQPELHREKVAEEILEILRYRGNFAVNGLEEFWQTFRKHLCSSCQTKLDSLSEKRRRARQLLEEAAKLDPRNQTTKQNLDVVRKMT